MGPRPTITNKKANKSQQDLPLRYRVTFDSPPKSQQFVPLFLDGTARHNYQQNKPKSHRLLPLFRSPTPTPETFRNVVFRDLRQRARRLRQLVSRGRGPWTPIVDLRAVIVAPVGLGLPGLTLTEDHSER